MSQTQTFFSDTYSQYIYTRYRDEIEKTLNAIDKYLKESGLENRTSLSYLLKTGRIKALTGKEIVEKQLQELSRSVQKLSRSDQSPWSWIIPLLGAVGFGLPGAFVGAMLVNPNLGQIVSKAGAEITSGAQSLWSQITGGAQTLWNILTTWGPVMVALIFLYLIVELIKTIKR